MQTHTHTHAPTCSFVSVYFWETCSWIYFDMKMVFQFQKKIKNQPPRFSKNCWRLNDFWCWIPVVGGRILKFHFKSLTETENIHNVWFWMVANIFFVWKMVKKHFRMLKCCHAAIETLFFFHFHYSTLSSIVDSGKCQCLYLCVYVWCNEIAFSR